ncbi:MAG: hypothetical protein ACI35R_14835 [Bacillus sp. (in: firmicutes)]
MYTSMIRFRNGAYRIAAISYNPSLSNPLKHVEQTKAKQEQILNQLFQSQKPSTNQADRQSSQRIARISNYDS